MKKGWCVSVSGRDHAYLSMTYSSVCGASVRFPRTMVTQNPGEYPCKNCHQWIESYPDRWKDGAPMGETPKGLRARKAEGGEL